MKPYPDYFITPLPWLPNIPAHWELVRNKNIFEETKDVVGDDIDAYPLLSLTTKGIILRDVASGKGKFPKDFNTYKIVKPGDMAFCLFDIDETPRTVGLSQYNGMLTGAYTIFHVANINPHYAYYYYLSLDNVKAMRPLYSGLRKTINTGTFLSCKLPLPPRPEQDQIVRFLDWKVSSINKLIGVKQRQISTLKELMQAEIEKQLRVYPVVDTVRLKQLGTFFKGGGFSRDNLVEGGGYPAILYGDIYTQYEYKTSVITHSIDSNAYDVSRKIVKSDIVMAGTGETKDEIGKSILYMGDEVVAAGGDVIVFRPNEGINVEYLLYQLYSQAALKHRYIHGKGDIIVHIYPAALGNTLISLSDEENQVKAVERINEIIDQVKKAIATLTKEISILREFKARLVADTVIGRIDVRGIKIPECEFVEETVDTENDESMEGMEGETYEE